MILKINYIEIFSWVKFLNQYIIKGLNLHWLKRSENWGTFRYCKSVSTVITRWSRIITNRGRFITNWCKISKVLIKMYLTTWKRSLFEVNIETPLFKHQHKVEFCSDHWSILWLKNAPLEQIPGFPVFVHENYDRGDFKILSNTYCWTFAKI